MAVFSNKIKTASYINEGHSAIEIIYTDDAGALTVYVVEADPNQQDYVDLVQEGWTAQKLVDATAEIKKAQSKAFDELVNSRVQEILTAREAEVEKRLKQREVETHDRLKAREDQMNLKLQQTVVKKETLEGTIVNKKQELKAITQDGETWMLQFLMDNNDNKEFLFKMKLWALELDIIKKASKEVKTKIRKAPTSFAGLSIINELLKSSKD